MKLVLALFEKAHALGNGNVYNPVYEVIEQATLESSFHRKDDELLVYKMYNIAESQDLTRGLVRHLTSLSNFTVPVARFVT